MKTHALTMSILREFLLLGTFIEGVNKYEITCATIYIEISCVMKLDSFIAEQIVSNVDIPSHLSTLGLDQS